VLYYCVRSCSYIALNVNNIRTACSHSKKLQDLSKQHVVLLDQLPAQTDGGWMVHSVQKQEAVGVATVEPSAIHVSEDTQDGMELEDTSTANNGSTQLDSVRRKLQSKLQQCIVDVSVCNDTEALLRALKHASAAHAIMHAATKHRPARLPVRKKLPAYKKLDKQLRFCSTMAKGQARRQTLHKPSTDKLTTSVKQLLVGPEAEDSQASHIGLSDCPATETSGAEPDSIMQLMQAAFFVDAGCLDVPLYCVRSEEVSTL